MFSISDIFILRGLLKLPAQSSSDVPSVPDCLWIVVVFVFPKRVRAIRAISVYLHTLHIIRLSDFKLYVEALCYY